jgi:hypothetical protein
MGVASSTSFATFKIFAVRSLSKPSSFTSARTVSANCPIWILDGAGRLACSLTFVAGDCSSTGFLLGFRFLFSEAAADAEAAADDDAAADDEAAADDDAIDGVGVCFPVILDFLGGARESANNSPMLGTGAELLRPLLGLSLVAGGAAMTSSSGFFDGFPMNCEAASFWWRWRRRDFVADCLLELVVAVLGAAGV